MSSCAFEERHALHSKGEVTEGVMRRSFSEQQ